MLSGFRVEGLGSAELAGCMFPGRYKAKHERHDRQFKWGDLVNRSSC